MNNAENQKSYKNYESFLEISNKISENFASPTLKVLMVV